MMNASTTIMTLPRRLTCRSSVLNLTARCRSSRPSLIRSFSAVAKKDEEEEYVSPLQELFDRMERNGPTTLGTTKFVPLYDKMLKCGVPESALRYSTTSYGRTMMPPHVHVNEHRVTLRVDTSDLPLNTDLEKEILRQIVGPRLLADRGELRLTSNQFGSRIENKRHLESMLERIIFSCQRLAREATEEQAATQNTPSAPSASEGEKDAHGSR